MEVPTMTAFFMGTSLTQSPGNQRPGTNSTNEFTLIPEEEQNLQKTSDMKPPHHSSLLLQNHNRPCLNAGECPPPKKKPKTTMLLELVSHVGRRGAAASVTQT